MRRCLAHLLLVAVTAGCSASPCADRDADREPLDSSTAVDGDGGGGCSSRLVIGPVILDPLAHGGPIGLPCNHFARTAPIDMRVRVFDSAVGPASPDALPVVDRIVTCTPESTYFDLGAVAPGTYDIAIEVVGADLMVGGDLLRQPCELDGYRVDWCWPVLVELPPCDVRVVSAALGCADPSMANCDVGEWSE